MHELLPDHLEQIADAKRVSVFDMLIVNDEQDDSTARLGGPCGPRED